jgi:hypothetical protein
MYSKNEICTLVLSLSLLLLANCGVKDAIDDSIDAVECANLIERIEEDGDNRDCAEQIADINKILNTCDEFLSQEQKDAFNFIKENCQDN